MSDPARTIANLKAFYCRAADAATADPAAARARLVTLFTDDAVADYGEGPMAGCEAIADFLCGAIAGGSAWMIHLLASPAIEVAGDTATGEWAVSVHSGRRDGTSTLVLGRYDDAFRLTAAGWRIARIGFRRIG